MNTNQIMYVPSDMDGDMKTMQQEMHEALSGSVRCVSWIQVTESVPIHEQLVLVSRDGVVSTARYATLREKYPFPGVVTIARYSGKLGQWLDSDWRDEPTPDYWAELPMPPIVHNVRR